VSHFLACTPAGYVPGNLGRTVSWNATASHTAPIITILCGIISAGKQRRECASYLALIILFDLATISANHALFDRSFEEDLHNDHGIINVYPKIGCNNRCAQTTFEPKICQTERINRGIAFRTGEETGPRPVPFRQIMPSVVLNVRLRQS
jgi:hypothetical protein